MFTTPLKPIRSLIALITLISLLLLNWSSYPSNSLAAETEQSYWSQVMDRVTEFTLDNGMKFIILENHQAPVVSFVTYADVGGANEPDGKTGIAHFLEHLAFKGTDNIGTTNYSEEQKLLSQLDQLSGQIKTAQAAGKTEQVAQLKEQFTQIQEQAQQYVKQNEFGQIVEQQGGVGLNAATSADSTVYFYSFPSNKVELWMSLESERFLKPVFREFYKEQDVILEERRMRTDNSPIGRLVEAFLGTAFTEHPYKRPVIGYAKDIRNLSRDDVEQFFKTYYVPNNITVVIAGDVNPQEIERLAKIYFARYPAQPQPPKVTKVEPPQKETREVTINLPSQPWYIEGYHRPAISHPDNAVYEIIGGLMSNGYTSRLYKSLVEEKKIALTAQGYSGFPGDKYPNLMLFYAMTAPNATVDQVAQALHTEIERLKNEPVSEQELNRIKTQIRANLVRSLDSNLGMAQLLAEYQVKTGSWKNLFKQLDQIAAITPEDIQRVAQETFTPENRSIGRLLPAENNNKNE